MCLIDEICYKAETINTDNPCLRCDPDKATKNWTKTVQYFQEMEQNIFLLKIYIVNA